MCADLKIRCYRFALALYWLWAQVLCCFRTLFGKVSARPKVMIIPCEPWSIVGSRGDEAMIVAIIQHFRQEHPEGEVVIISGTPDFERTTDGQRLRQMSPTGTGASPLPVTPNAERRTSNSELGDLCETVSTGTGTPSSPVGSGDALVPDAGQRLGSSVRFLHAWRGRIPIRAIFRALCSEAPTEFYVLGADCMDGHYSVWTSLILLASADLGHRLGIPTHLTGFSFNEHPESTLLPYYRLVSSSFVFNVRDAVSLARFVEQTGRRARLVADVAFNLVPEHAALCDAHFEWARAQKARGRSVIGFNLHILLVPEGQPFETFARRVADQLSKVLENRSDLALLFIPHDYRGGGDVACLQPVYQPLSERFPDRVRLVEEVLSAAQLKGLCVALDGLFTSRMHLGIAALGMGVPVMGFVYQGKFAGLWRHFELPQTYCLCPGAIGTDEMSIRLCEFLSNLSDLRAQVACRYSSVKALAELNFEALS